MSWKWRKPRVPVEPVLGWRAPHELVDDYAARGVEIARLNGILGNLSGHIDRQAESMRKGESALNVAAAELDHATATVKDLRGELAKKEDQIQRQANNHQADRADWERTKSWMAARIDELEQTVVAMSAASGGLDEAWRDVAAVSGPQSKSVGRQ